MVHFPWLIVSLPRVCRCVGPGSRALCRPCAHFLVLWGSSPIGFMPDVVLKWVWINTYENTIFSGMNIHKSQLFWCELQRYQGFDTLPNAEVCESSVGFWSCFKSSQVLPQLRKDQLPLELVTKAPTCRSDYPKWQKMRKTWSMGWVKTGSTHVISRKATTTCPRFWKRVGKPFITIVTHYIYIYVYIYIYILYIYYIYIIYIYIILL